MSHRLVSRPRLAVLVLVLAGCPSFSEPGTSATSATSAYEPTSEPFTTTDGATSVGTTPPTTSASPTTTEPTTTTTDAATTDSTTGADQGKMSEYGHACADDDECVAILGAGAVCLTDVLGLYELPGGYCSKLCELPPQTPYVFDDLTCGRGVVCIGADGYFEACAVECEANSECPRDGYECRLMPTLGLSGDPRFCLMTDEFMTQ
ncbi:hypothetical protein [Nannocystis pusilla]|uniref:Lipoprotein n=1 Tax=Nannocystis pusilla TaxID=889268 RepID=A0ABS7TKS3_9BACT|nr:hypothetical protein [Nannocystis pusilla]MBZ5708825.1 hypothetical protein [Nannocystis pusilla]